MPQKNKKIYRTYRKLTQEEQKEKFGFCEMDLIKEGSYLLPPYNEIFEHGCLVAEDSTERKRVTN